MKDKVNYLIIFISFISSLIFISACCSDSKKELTSSIPTTLDTMLANKLGADDYGMKKYVIAFLKSGPNRPTDSIARVELQAAHMENINRLATEGKLVLAGPFLDDGSLRGIYVFDVESIEEAEALSKTDPAIQSGSLIMELHPWYGSAALMKVNEIHKKIAKINI